MGKRRRSLIGGDARRPGAHASSPPPEEPSDAEAPTTAPPVPADEAPDAPGMVVAPAAPPVPPSKQDQGPDTDPPMLLTATPPPPPPLRGGVSRSPISTPSKAFPRRPPGMEEEPDYPSIPPPMLISATPAPAAAREITSVEKVQDDVAFLTKGEPQNQEVARPAFAEKDEVEEDWFTATPAGAPPVIYDDEEVVVDHGPSLGTMAIAGMVVGVVLALAVVGATVFWLIS